MVPERFAVLVNLAGFLAGLALYSMLLVMVLRRLRGPVMGAALGSAGVRWREYRWLPRELLPLATAALGICWNMGALVAFGLVDFGVVNPEPLFSVIAFTALGFLPSVVVHSVLRPAPAERRDRAALAMLAISYALSTTAGVLHLHAVIRGEMVPSALGLRLLTVGFLGLIPPLALQARRQLRARRVLWMVSLAVFAVSAHHLPEHNAFRDSWMMELVGHHASLPLAIAILYQEYPFALADLFLKRVLTIVALVAVGLGAYALAAARALSHPNEQILNDPVLVGGLLALWVATAWLTPALQRAVAWFVDAVVLRRADYAQLPRTIARAIAVPESPEGVLEEACRHLAPALASRETAYWRMAPSGRPERIGSLQGTASASWLENAIAKGVSDWETAGHGSVVQAGPQGTSAVVLIPTGETPRYALTLASLAGGRRLLSDDVAMLERVAYGMARRIDGLRITRERYEQRVREAEMSRLTTEAELRALRAQINPHFLFNTLTTVAYLIQTAPDRARDTLMRLTDLLRRVLRSEGEFTTLGSELEFVSHYLDLERARFEERLTVTIDVPAALHTVRIPSFLIQPLVENAIKHAVAPASAGGQVEIRAWLEGGDGPAPRVPTLCVVVKDTGRGAAPARPARWRHGVGLKNLEQRLRHHYGAAASLRIETGQGTGTSVEVRVPIDVGAAEFAGSVETVDARLA